MSDSDLNVLKFTHRPKIDSRWVKYFRFFATNRGKDVTFKVVCGVGIVASGGISLGYTYFLENVINLFRFYEHGVQLEVPSYMEDRIDEVVEFLKTPGRQVAYLDSFLANGFDMMHLGSTVSSYKGWIGIPVNFLYTSKQDIDVMNMRIGSEVIDWSSEAADRLASALLLTENEQKFALVRAVLHLKNLNHVHGTLVPAFSFMGLYTAAQYVNYRFNLLSKSPFLRGIVYFGLSISTYAMYRLMTDIITLQQATTVDKKIAELGPELCQAGIDYYTKILEKNRAIHDLSGGELFQANGEESYGFLQLKWLVLTPLKRQQYLQYRLDEYQKSQVEQTDATKVVENAEPESK